MSLGILRGIVTGVLLRAVRVAGPGRGARRARGVRRRGAPAARRRREHEAADDHRAEHFHHRRYGRSTSRGCVWLLWWTRPRRRRAPSTERHHRARVGRRPRRDTTIRCRAGGCGCSSSPWCSASCYLVLYPGLGTSPARSAGRRTPSTRREAAANARAHREDACAVRGAHGRRAGRRSARRSTSAATCSSTTARPATAPTRGARRAFPTWRDKDWLWGGDPDTRARDVPTAARRDAAVGRRCSVRSGVEDVLAYVLQPAGRKLEAGDTAARGQAEVRGDLCSACHGPDGQGNPAHGRAQPHRRHLAARRLAGGGARDHRRRAAMARCRRTRRASAKRASNYWRPTCCHSAGRAAADAVAGNGAMSAQPAH